MSNLIVPSAKEPGFNGSRLVVTPQNAGWSYVGFEVYTLTEGQTFQKDSGGNELCVILLSGKASVSTEKKSWENIGKRMSVFEQIAPYAVYVPSSDYVNITANTSLEVAICSAPGKGTYEARLISPDDIAVEIRGTGDMQRQINNILPESAQADSLLIVEVFTPNGNWSSYPPHKHDQNNLPNETYLEETYYHRIKQEGGFAIQRVYTDDDSLNETMVVKDGDVVLVPKGYHPVSAPPGYDLYYLNTMAGPVRTWKFQDDKDHAWLKTK
ncbi:5-deoxy-glucuronate isomerase [Paenibacillus alginolyticus]|uniref:5-deoxy-glucuronate isomerase n=1 Tax=Paenibacillus alginolyticus TaxID=59839 RepID=UPI0004027826|nr:5-deoxy-glucuronate isomerase [Paenibacillus alginolyticus]MCY9665786.1 5-deoxy-glucuronate isomerase [Paenibacillus alginolyticus]